MIWEDYQMIWSCFKSLIELISFIESHEVIQSTLIDEMI